MTFNEIEKEWLNMKRGIVKESTVCTYASVYNYAVKPYFGNKEVSDFVKADGQKFLSHLLSSGKSVKSSRDAIIVLRQIVEYAAEIYDLNIPVDFKVKYPTRNMDDDDKKIKSYTKEETEKIIKYCFDEPSSRNLGIIICFYTGMRIGELCGLRWDDVDFSERIIKVSRTLERIHEPGQRTKVVLQTPKTRHSRREIPINRNLIPTMKKFYSVSKPEYYIISGSKNPIEPRVYRNYYRTLILDKVKLSHCLNFHSIRHTFASLLITGGQDVKTVSEILGHSNPGITLSIYAHTNPMTKRKCADSLKFI